MPLNIAVWGLGPHATRRILPAIAAAGGVRLRGVCSRNAAAVDASSREWSCAGWTDPDDMLRDGGVDAVYISTPTGLHAVHSRRVLDAGKHAWVEKPIAAGAAEAAGLIDLSRARGLTLCEAFMYLYHPQFAQLRGYVQSGRLGRVVAVASRFGIPPLDTPGFRNDPALGGGAFLDVGCYPVSALVALFPEASFAVSLARIHARPGSPVDTEGHAIIAASNGVTAHLEWRTHCAYRNEIFIWGEAGAISTELIFSKPEAHVPAFQLTDLKGARVVESGAAANHFVGMLETFGDAVSDPGRAEEQRRGIRARAELMQDIKSTGSEHETVAERTSR